MHQIITASKDGNAIVFEKYTREPSVLVDFVDKIEKVWGWIIEEEIIEVNVSKKDAISGINRLRRDYYGKSSLGSPRKNLNNYVE